MTSGLRAGVVGATGFLGGEVVRLLAGHPNVELSAVASSSRAGQRLSSLRPSLVGPADRALVPVDPVALARDCDVVFLALPHGASAVLARQLLAEGTRVIDLGSDFRLLEPADHVRWYGREPSAPELLGEAVYSLPELTGRPDPKARLIANPGCFATALALLLAPLAAALDPDAKVSLFGITGSSGSGIEPSVGVHHSLRRTDFKAYKPLTHQHLGEVTQLLAGRGTVPRLAFVPHSAPTVRGIHVTALVDRDALDGDALQLLEAAYEGKPLVTVRRGTVNMGAVIGSVRCDLGVVEQGDQVAVFSTIDNLLKGGSGQAVQNLNAWMGWDELLGLPIAGVWP